MKKERSGWMKPYRIEIENGIEYIVIELDIKEYGDIKKFIKENWEFLSKPHFKFLVYDNGLMITQYMYKYQHHNRFGPAFFVRNNDPLWYLNDIQYSEEEFVNELRNRTLKNILDEI